MTYRNRELLNLVAVGLLTGIGFASVYIARQSEVSRGLALVRRVLHRPLPRRAPRRPVHRPLRGPVPAADGRAPDRRRADRDLPARSRRRVPAGTVGRDRGRLPLAHPDRPAPGLPRARALQVPVRPRRDRAARCSRRSPGSAPRSTARASGCASGSLSVPAGRDREADADRLPGRLPARQARGARPGAAEGLRAAAPDLGRRDARARPDERPRAARSSTSGSSSACSTSRPDGSSFVAGRARRCSWRARTRPTTSCRVWHDRIAIWLRSVVPTRRREGYQLVQSTYSIGIGGFGGTGLGRGTFTTTEGNPIIPFAQHRLHLRRDRAGARA